MKNIFVGNLSFGATEDAVRSLFEAYGTVERVSIVTDRDSGQPRGFGFVEMSANAEADRAIAELNGRELDGRALNVNEARPKTDRGGARQCGGRPRVATIAGNFLTRAERACPCPSPHNHFAGLPCSRQSATKSAMLASPTHITVSAPPQ